MDYLQQVAETMKSTSRCGLGQTAGNPVLSTLKNFRARYESLLGGKTNGFEPAFDLGKAVSVAEKLAGRKSVHV
jgi:hypothetical protein